MCRAKGDKLKAHLARRLELVKGLLADGCEVLDVGCGTGSYITNYLGRLPVSVTAIDYDRESIEYAKNHNRYENVKYIKSSGEFFWSDKQYDVIVCSHVLEHSPSPQRILENLRRLIKDEGELFLAIPNGYGCFEIENYLPRIVARTDWGRKLIDSVMGRKVKDSLNHDNPHIQFFTLQSIKEVLSSVGFKVVKQFNEQIIGGVVTDRTILRLPMMARWNMWLGDRLPSQLSNGWIFICEKKAL